MAIGLHNRNSCKGCDYKDNKCICYKCSNKRGEVLMGDMFLCGCFSSITISGSDGLCSNYIEDWVKALKYG